MALNPVQQSREEQSRPHIFEIDPLRAVTALCVVGVHAVALTVFLNQSPIGAQIQSAIVVALHYTRELFMFVSSFALVYVYYRRPFHLKSFWKKRSIGVLLPYCIWSAVYVHANVPQLPFGQYIQTTLFAILTGTASFQLYYILLTLQFYITLPLFLVFLKYVDSHPWITLMVSFIIQVVMLYLDYHYLQTGALNASSIWRTIAQYQGSFLLTYQFYFILGAMAAIYMEQVRSFLLRHGRLIASGFTVIIAVLWAHFLIQVNVFHESLGYAVSVLQPIMTFYSVAIIVFFYWLASLWTRQANQAGHPKGYKFWHTLSDASFGIYLIHVLILIYLLHWLVPAMPTTWPVALRVFLTWFLTASSATLVTIILMNIPILSRLVGRARSSQRLNMLKARIKSLFIHSPVVKKGQSSHDAQHV
ncbi:MAG: hypothetical protein NVS3B14_14320 [Ktedonobacteraceae bacterium]